MLLREGRRERLQEVPLPVEEVMTGDSLEEFEYALRTRSRTQSVFGVDQDIGDLSFDHMDRRTSSSSRCWHLRSLPKEFHDGVAHRIAE